MLALTLRLLQIDVCVFVYMHELAQVNIYIYIYIFAHMFNAVYHLSVPLLHRVVYMVYIFLLYLISETDFSYFFSFLRLSTTPLLC